jgi:hypothetical protein
MNVNAGVASAVVRMGIYSDTGTGYPGALLVDAGTIDAATAGVKEAALATPNTLLPGTYWLAYALRGAAGVAVRGFAGPAVDSPQNTSTNALTSGVMYQSPVAGAFPAAFAFTNDSSLGYARMAYKIPLD